MKAFVFDPLYPELITEQNKADLAAAGIDVHLVTEPVDLTSYAPLYEGDEPRIIGINPDYVGWKFTAEQFEKVPNLKAIITQSTSYGWIDMNRANELGVPVVNLRQFHTNAVSEWAITMMFNVARKLPLLIKAGFPLDYDKDYKTYQGVDLAGKAAGIIGLGNNGMAIANRCAGLGMNVIYWNRSPKESDYKAVELDDIFTKADVIFPVLADIPETENLITNAHFDSMKPTSMFISILHKMYDRDYVLKLVAEDKIYGYAFEGEPAAFNSYEGNVWGAPKYAWCTDGSMRNSMDQFVAMMVRAAKNQFPQQVAA